MFGSRQFAIRKAINEKRRRRSSHTRNAWFSPGFLAFVLDSLSISLLAGLQQSSVGHRGDWTQLNAAAAAVNWTQCQQQQRALSATASLVNIH